MQPRLLARARSHGRARTAADYAQLWSDRRLAYEYLPTNDEHWQAALDVTLLHYDADVEIAAEVVPFQHRWALERGTIE